MRSPQCGRSGRTAWRPAMLFWLALEPLKRLLLMLYHQFYYQSNYQFHHQTQKDLSLIVDLGCGVPSDPFNPVLSRSKILADPSLGMHEATGRFPLSASGCALKAQPDCSEGIYGGMPAARSAGRAGRGHSPLRGAVSPEFSLKLPVIHRRIPF